MTAPTALAAPWAHGALSHFMNDGLDLSRRAQALLPLREKWRLRDGRASGRPVRSDEHPRVDIQSDSFKRWFGDSVLTRPDGRPASFWHGTFQDFDAFDGDPELHPAHRRDIAGFYFTPIRDYACRHGYNVFEVCLKVRCPRITFDYAEACHVTARQVASLEAGGYDAIAFSLMKDPKILDEIVVFRPEQICIIQRKHVGGMEVTV